MKTTKPMTKMTNVQRFNAAKVTLASAVKHHSDDIDLNTPKYFGMGVFRDVDFLVKLVESLTGGKLAKLNAVKIEEDEEETEDVEIEEDADAALAAV